MTLIAVGCGGPSPAPPSGPAATQRRTTEPAASARIGRHPLLSPSNDEVGSLDIEPVADGTLSIDIAIDEAAGPHPWGIYDQASCAMPSPDRDAPFQFADIEGGQRTEHIDTQGFSAYPAQLFAIVTGDNGSRLYGCADLGPGDVTASPTDAAAGGCADTPSPQPAPAPASGDIAFSADILADSEIQVMYADGTGVQRLTSSLGVDMKPTWSPHGSHIAFRSQRDGNDEIYVMNADGSCQRNLTNSAVDDRSPAWSPDGRTIAFDHFFNDTVQDVALMAIDGSDLRAVTTSSGEYPTWSPDGRQIAFASARTGYYEIYVINADGTNERRLTNDGTYDMYPAWAPDGTHIAYEHGLDGFDESMDIFQMTTDGTDQRQLTNNEVQNRFPAWSANGRLAWSAGGSIVVAADATSTSTPKPIGAGQFPAWRPSSGRIGDRSSPTSFALSRPWSWAGSTAGPSPQRRP